VLKAVDRVLEAAIPRGITVGVPPESPENAAHWMEKGVRLFESATVDGLLAQAAGDHLRSFRGAVETTSN
jgi:2-keto-3-deoxy-L-rhamnonate aldolase RhmA